MIEKFAPLISKLELGLNINIQFSDACDFEENEAYQLFNHFGIRLYHAWVIDPKYDKLHSLIGDKTYEETTDFLLSEPNEDATDEERKKLEDDKDIIRQFLVEV